MQKQKSKEQAEQQQEAMKGTTTLTSVDIRNVGEANAVFGTDTSVSIVFFP